MKGWIRMDIIDAYSNYSPINVERNLQIRNQLAAFWVIGYGLNENAHKMPCAILEITAKSFCGHKLLWKSNLILTETSYNLHLDLLENK